MKTALPILAVVLAACGPDSDYDTDLAGAGVTLLDVSQDVTLLVSAFPPSCPILTHTTATLDGVVLEPQFSGGTVVSSSWTRSRSCMPPSWRFPSIRDPRASSVIVIKDDSATITYEVAHLFTAPALRLIEPASGTAHGGDVVEVQWEPETDVLNGGFQIRFDDRLIGNGGAAQGNRVRITLPAVTTAKTGKLELLAEGHRGVVRCEGIEKCQSLLFGMPGVGLTVVP